MAGLCCCKCGNNSVEPEVRVYHKNHLDKTFSSALKAMNYALESMSTPCVLKYIYVCSYCGFEENKLERYYDERLPDSYYLIRDGIRAK